MRRRIPAGAGNGDLDGPVGEDKKASRARNFSATEALHVARAWIASSRAGPYQTEEGLFARLTEMCTEQFNMMRTMPSIKSLWQRLAHDTQIFLAAEATILKRKISGHTAESRAECVMNLYRMKNKKESDGTFSYAPAYK